MNITYLKYAVEVEKTGSITKAADNLFMGQPNLSKAIKELEASIGITIFKRTSKGVIPTKKGEEFLNHGKMILAQMKELEKRYQPLDKSAVRLGICVPRASYITRAFTNWMNKVNWQGGMEINFKETNATETIQNIIEGEYQLGIIRYPIAYEKYYKQLLLSKGLHVHVIWEFEYLILMSQTHPLAKQEFILYDDLVSSIEISHGDLIVPPLSSVDYQKKLMNQPSKKQIYVYERGSQFDLLQFVPGTYMWAPPLPDDTLKSYGLIQRKCEETNYKNKDILIYLENQKFGTLEKQFVEEIMMIKEKIMEKAYL